MNKNSLNGYVEYDINRGEMNNEKRKKLEAADFAVSDAQDFLNLTAEEIAYIEIKRSLGRHLREKRKANHLTQTKAAELLNTSQSRLVKMEYAEKSVSIDLLVRANLALGATLKDLRLAF
jgi:predicted XRE-type DNA-binding protein